jgi:hypothetical protein
MADDELQMMFRLVAEACEVAGCDPARPPDIWELVEQVQKMKAKLDRLRARVAELEDAELIAWASTTGWDRRELDILPTAWVVKVHDDDRTKTWRVVQYGMDDRFPRRVLLGNALILTPEARDIIRAAMAAQREEAKHG